MCACVRACMHVCVHACMCVCVHMCMHVCVLACVHACMFVHACAFVHVCIHACICVQLLTSTPPPWARLMTTDRPASPYSANAPAAPTAATLESYSKQDATTMHALIQFSYSSVQITQTGTKSKTLYGLSCNSMKDFSWKAAEKMQTLRILPQMDSHTCSAPCKHTLFCMCCKQQLVQAAITRRCP